MTVNEPVPIGTSPDTKPAPRSADAYLGAPPTPVADEVVPTNYDT